MLRNVVFEKSIRADYPDFSLKTVLPSNGLAMLKIQITQGKWGGQVEKDVQVKLSPKQREQYLHLPEALSSKMPHKQMWEDLEEQQDQPLKKETGQASW